MKKIILLTFAATLVWAGGALACDSKIVKTVCPQVIELIALPVMAEMNEIVELTPIPDIEEIKAFAVTMASAAFELEAVETVEIVETTVTVEDQRSSGGVVFTVAKAVGKALLKAIAVLVGQVV